MEKFEERHKYNFTLEDYQKAINVSSKPPWGQHVSQQADVFISYSKVDQRLATELGNC